MVRVTKKGLKLVMKNRLFDVFLDVTNGGSIPPTSTKLNIMNLYERLKPEVKKAIKESAKRYPHSGRVIIAKLHLHRFYSDLTMSDIRDLINFSNVQESDWNYIDWKYGDKLFNDE